MKVEWKDTEDPGVGGNFLIRAETATERGILRRFSIANRTRRMWLHNTCYSGDLCPGGVTSINLGLIEKKVKSDEGK